MAFEQSAPNEEDCNEIGLDAAKTDLQNNPFHITGYISKPDHGMGRSTADRQFLYINKRPCELSKVLRVINEVYHTYNRHQYPFVMLDITLARGEFWLQRLLLCTKHIKYSETYFYLTPQETLASHPFNTEPVQCWGRKKSMVAVPN